MSQDLQTLVNSSEEARAILTNFAKRKRIHKGIPLNIMRFYRYFVDVEHRKLSITKFNEVFISLERLGHGWITMNSSGEPIEFVAKIHIKFIGIEALGKQLVTPKEVIKEEPMINPDKVLVLFTLKGLKCKAEVPKDAVDEFQELVRS